MISIIAQEHGMKDLKRDLNTCSEATPDGRGGE